MPWKDSDPCGNESGKVRWELVPYTRGRGLDLGCGPDKAFPHFIGVDNYTDTHLFGIQMKPDVVCDVKRLDVFGSASMDFAYSSHCLEHIPYDKVPSTLKEWWRVVKPGGYLILYLPDEDEYPKVGEKGANPDHKWNVNYDRVVEPMKDIGGWDLLRFEKRNHGYEYSLFFVFKKRTDGKHTYPFKQPKPEKTAALVRYGAFGDLIQTSSVLPGLKEQGFHVTVYTTPRGAEVIKHDPHVDAFYIQDTDQVPNHLLSDFWNHEAKKYDRWINLSESVEATWLALAGRYNHSWPKPVRDKYLNTNYFEFTHDLAQVPFDPKPKFYATDEEKAWAKKERANWGGDFALMFALAGSSVHKVWPWQDQFIARLLLANKDARIVLVGDEHSQLLEIGWEKEPRVLMKCGKYTIRQTLALLAEMDMVVGPETGVLNAAGHMDMTKIVFLSHSSPENLTQHWVNTKALQPHTACFPCHQMHYSFEHCNRNEQIGVAQCQVDISLDMAWNAFLELTGKVIPIQKAA